MRSNKGFTKRANALADLIEDVIDADLDLMKDLPFDDYWFARAKELLDLAATADRLRDL